MTKAKTKVKDFAPVQTRFAQFRADSVDLENRTADFVISNESVDSFNTVFKVDGWDLNRYNQNPIVTYNHFDFSSNPDVVLGTSEVRIENGELVATVHFEDAENNPLAEKILRKVQNKILRGASISCHIEDARMGDETKGEDPEVLYFTRQHLNAWSIVTIPSNKDALARNNKDLEKIKESIDSQERTEPTEIKMRPQDAQILINRNSLKK